MLFKILVTLILIVLLVHQFDLWTKFKHWLNNRTNGDNPLNKSHQVKLNAYGLIVIVGVVAALITAYFQVSKAIDVNATTLALQSLNNSEVVMTDAALANSVAFFQESFNFAGLYFNQFVENAVLYILLPILISLGTVFMQDEMKKNKDQLTNITIGKEESNELEVETPEDIEPF